MVNHPLVYATRDYEQTGPDFGRIREDAEIQVFTSRSAAEAWLRDGYKNDGPVIISTSTEWGDAWIKSIDAPHVDTTWIAPFRLDDLYIQGPGEHPGGRFYWITPSADISILVAILATDDGEG